jgi:crotonobetainyl-CoA:carnitine CoA-transferase CaiB-like acyl-CoA transferase
MAGPLAGYRILELTSTVSGPVAGMILGDQGADIIKIEPPMIGDLARFMGDISNGMGAMFSTLNRNKRSLVLDLKHPGDMAIFLQLVPETDVLIENYRPGIVDKLGIDYASLSEINPGLVYASISGYGQSGPYQHRRVYDPLIQATAGTSAEQDGERPTNVRTVIFDKVTGYTTAQAITAALLQRERTGRGEYLPISMLQSALYYQWSDVMWSHTWQSEDVQYSGTLADYFQIYKTADGWVSLVLVADEAFKYTCELVGIDAHLDDKFATFPARVIHRDELQQLLDGAFTGFTTQTLCEKMDEFGAPIARVNTLEEMFDDPQVVEQGSIVDLEHPVAGPMKVANTPFQFSGQDPLPSRHAATHGQHSTEILEELGVAREEIERIEARERANREMLAGFTLQQAGKK